MAILLLEFSKSSPGTQSSGIHDVHLFHTELAMHYSTIFKYGCFRLFCEEKETLCVLVHIFHDKSKTGVFFDWFHEKIEVIGQILDGNENSMFRHPLGLLEQNLSHLHSKLRHLRWPVHVPLFWSCHILTVSVIHVYYWPDTWQHGICWLIITHAACTHI